MICMLVDLFAIPLGLVAFISNNESSGKTVKPGFEGVIYTTLQFCLFVCDCMLLAEHDESLSYFTTREAQVKAYTW